MKRDLESLSQETFDVLIIGGGIYGAALAREAVLRGLKTALIEQGDFAGGASSNSLKIVHGGLRYLQHADFSRMRESITERRILLKIAPHLVRPLPCVMPTYGHFIKGPEAMRAAIMLNDLISFDRNFGLKPDRRLPRGRMLSKQEFLDIVPFIRRESLNGGALWYDGLMVNSERLLFAFLHFAAERGLTVANYVKAESLLLEKNRVVGVTVYDRLGDQRFDVRAKLTVAAPGSRLNDILRQTADQPEVRFSTAVNLVLSRRFTSEYAFAAPTQRRYKDQDALIDRGSRLLFFVPWRGVTLAGTAHQPYLGDPADYHVTEEEVESFLAEVNSALPDAQIRRDEVRLCRLAAHGLGQPCRRRDARQALPRDRS
ncbi:MAG: FAD-dependent oxidoreductase [candidate division KSB1 bacterium]|nr:FAD-dependent oxidoreductase [candidate division KSB1 bacterium]